MFFLIHVTLWDVHHHRFSYSDIIGVNLHLIGPLKLCTITLNMGGKIILLEFGHKQT